MSEKTDADRRHDVKMAFLGFMLTSVAGAFITFVFSYAEKSREEAKQDIAAEVQLTEQRRTSATALFDELSPLMDNPAEQPALVQPPQSPARIRRAVTV